MKPVSGKAMALLTANEVMTQTAWLALAPRLPAMVGSETLAMVMSSTCMNIAIAMPIVASTRFGGEKPGMPIAVLAGGAGGAASFVVSADILDSTRSFDSTRAQREPEPRLSRMMPSISASALASCRA